jgi:proline iminopeptidase
MSLVHRSGAAKLLAVLAGLRYTDGMDAIGYWLVSLTLWTASPRRIGPPPAPTTDGVIAGADGVQLYYRVVGTGTDTVVLLHGGPGLNIGHAWPDLAPLAQHFVVVMYDQRGAGRSEIIKDSTRLTATDHVRDLEAVRQHFALARMTLVGESWGGGLAILYAAAHPDRVGRMLLLGPMPPTEQLYTLRERKLNAVAGASLALLPNLMKEMATAQDPVPACRRFTRVYFTAHFADTAAASRMKIDPCDVPPEGIRNFPFVAEATMASLGHWNFLPTLRSLEMPVLIVDGAKSPATLEGMRVLARALPHGRLLLIPGAGHYAQVERPDLFFPPVERFLDGH